MRHYLAKSLEYTKPGFTDLFILSATNIPLTAGGAPVNDFSVGFSNQQILLTNLLAIGDTLLPGTVIDIQVPITGPTGSPTAQVKVNTANKALTPTVIVNGLAPGTTTDNTVVGAFMLQTGVDTLVLDLQAGGGNSAAATAGEIWVWARISRDGNRGQLSA